MKDGPYEVIEPRSEPGPRKFHIPWFMRATRPPLEIQLQLLRLAIHKEMKNEEKANLRLAELEALDKDRLEDQQNLELYQQRMYNAFIKRVKYRFFKRMI